MIPAFAQGVAVHRFVRDVESARGQAIEFGARLIPREALTKRGVIAHVGRYRMIDRIAGYGFHSRHRCRALRIEHLAQLLRGTADHGARRRWPAALFMISIYPGAPHRA